MYYTYTYVGMLLKMKKICKWAHTERMHSHPKLLSDGHDGLKQPVIAAITSKSKMKRKKLKTKRTAILYYAGMPGMAE